MFSYNYFFLPPGGQFTIAEPQNWMALFAFLVTFPITISDGRAFCVWASSATTAELTMSASLGSIHPESAMSKAETSEPLILPVIGLFPPF